MKIYIPAAIIAAFFAVGLARTAYQAAHQGQIEAPKVEAASAYDWRAEYRYRECLRINGPQPAYSYDPNYCRKAD